MPALKPETLDDKREALLLAAFRCCGRKGYRATSMRDICKEAGVSIGGLYCHYKNKEEVITAVAEMFRSRREAAAQQRSESMPQSAASVAITSSIRSMFEEVYQGDREALIADVSMMGEAVHIPVLKSVLQQADTDQIGSMRTLLEAKANVASADREAMAKLLTSVGFGMTVLAAYHDDFDYQASLALLEDLLAQSINKPAGSDEGGDA